MRQDNIFRLTPYDFRCVEKAITYINQFYMERISADRLSIEVGLTKDKLQAGMLLKIGLTLHEYILTIRVEKAKLLLIDTNNPVKSIADTTGFNNDSHFCKVFRKFTSVSPVKYRLGEAV
jgi:transcriptional regulator GlxA family with amidase domain